MISQIQGIIDTAGKSAPVSNLNTPSTDNVQQFESLMGTKGNLVEGSLKSFINNAENKLKIQNTDITNKLKSFNSKDNVIGLVEATYLSSVKAVSVQLTSKIGSKVSESFEQLIKQQ